MRLLLDSPAAGAWNMACDEALGATVTAGGLPVVRFYQWARPTLSLGYFQNRADCAAHAASRACDLVRRASGGGAILHDQELTYALVVPVAHPLAADAMQLYWHVHRSLVATLATWGITAQLRAASDVPAPKAAEPLLCFQRQAAGDVLLHGVKIAGSAQRRRQGAVLQHGSVLLGQSPFAPELPGIRDLCGVELSPQALASVWAPALATALGSPVVVSELTTAERAMADQFQREKYSQTWWTDRR